MIKSHKNDFHTTPWDLDLILKINFQSCFTDWYFEVTGIKIINLLQGPVMPNFLHWANENLVIELIDH